MPGSGWPSLREPLFHLTTAWDEWLREQLQLEGSSPEAADITTWADLAALREQMRGFLRRIIDESDDDALAAPRPMWAGTPAETLTTNADIVAHILLHERGHHGDITTLLEAAGAQIPAMDYLVYTFFRDRARA